MMDGLADERGAFRSCLVGVYQGKKLMHIAPNAGDVPELIDDLFNWYRTSELHPLIRSAVFHYEFEYIHPFIDGSGRMGRLWHKLLLGRWDGILRDLPFEEGILERQQEYYSELGKSSRERDESTYFIELMLEAILETLMDDSAVIGTRMSAKERGLPHVLGEMELSTAELMDALGVRRRQTFRDDYLLPAMRDGLVEMKHPDKPSNRNQKYRIRKQ